MICYEVLVQTQSAAVADEFVAGMRAELLASAVAKPGALGVRGEVGADDVVTVAQVSAWAKKNGIEGTPMHLARTWAKAHNRSVMEVV